MDQLIKHLAGRLGVKPAAAEAAVLLLDGGNTVPFIARYRKEQTGGLDDQSLRALERELDSYRRLEARREDILRLLDEQGVLSRELEEAVRAADSLTALEDLYRPYRPKRRTRASAAKEAGLLPLALALKDPEVSYRDLLLKAEKAAGSEAYPTAEAALGGASDILAEALAESPAVRGRMRRLLQQEGRMTAKAKKKEPSVYENYYDFSADFRKLKGYQVLALNRGEREGFLRLGLEEGPRDPGRDMEGFFRRTPDKAPLIETLCQDAWKRLLKPSLENELRSAKTEEANEEAMQIFSANLRSALMAPPLRGKTVLALDPGFRNGCKYAAADPTGAVLETGHIYPLPPQNRPEEAARQLSEAISRNGVQVLALGNGTATRETEHFLREHLLSEEEDLPLLIVNEAGASVYSASAAAAEEFPEMDVSLRSAVSLARRLQDPLAELVKVEPSALGLGQYQHDMDPKALALRLDRVTEDCVNEVGCNLNTASAALLSHIAGIGEKLAQNIVAYREENGPFRNRQELLQVPRLGEKAFLQCAGFLRIPDGDEFLDNTSVHPESYPAARALIDRFFPEGFSPDKAKEKNLGERLSRDEKARLADELGIGLPTLLDIIEALAKPGRDPRALRELPERSEKVRSIEELRAGMILPGVVRNVTAFGAFVDIGVHQDGLVHISELADRYVRNPVDFVQSGAYVKVKVLEVDPKKKRISLTMRPSKLKGQDN